MDLFVTKGEEERSNASVDDIDKAQLEKDIRRERYSMNYSRWNQWTPSDPVSLKEVRRQCMSCHAMSCHALFACLYVCCCMSD